MIVSLEWISDFIEINDNPNKLAENLTSLGLECTIESEKYSFQGVVIGKVKTKSDHPNADHLSLCDVDIGSGELKQIVCGAPNVSIGLKVPVVKVGGTLDYGKFKIKKSKLRGEVSNGMICSERELGTGDNHDGIMVLKTELKPGTPFENYLSHDSDVLINFDLTPNRGDCFSHLGIAREIGIIQKQKVIKSDIILNESSGKTSKYINIQINDKIACNRYAARIIKGIKVADSPEWLKLRLNKIGLNSINNIVDAANYVMFDSGHPMHTFDLEKIDGNQIIVRFPNNNEKLKVLDGSELKLDKKNLLICDMKKPLAIAGVIGGLDSGINENTKDILIECAHFKPEVIRRSAKLLDISTDSSRRFERGTDLNNIDNVINQCAELIQKIAGGVITKDIVDVGNTTKKNIIIPFRWERCNKYLGLDYSLNEYKKIFELLSFEIKKGADSIKLQIPSYRNDLTREVDLYEEAARVIGYDHIPASSTTTTSFSSFMYSNNECLENIRNILQCFGFNEHYSNGLYSEKYCKLFSKNFPLAIKNPLTKEMAFLRNSLIPGILKAISINSRKNNHNYKLFEIGQIHKYIPNVKTKSIENTSLGLAWIDKKNMHWRSIQSNDIYKAKGELEYILRKISSENIKYQISTSINFSCVLNVIINKVKVGIIGEINRKILNEFNIKESVVIFEGNFEKINKIFKSKKTTYKSPSHFPVIQRDIAILVDKEVQSEQIESSIRKNGDNILIDLKLFDLYEKNEFGKSKKSMAYSLTFQSDNKTLNDNTVDIVINKIINSLSNQFGANQR